MSVRNKQVSINTCNLTVEHANATISY